MWSVTVPAAIVLAAGQGTRMRSRLPKVLHPLAGRPMIEHILATIWQAGASPVLVVTGHGAAAVEAVLDGRVTLVRQEPQRGTAHAVELALGTLDPGASQVLVTNADAPLLPADDLARLLAAQAAADSPMALLGARLSEAAGYGRIVRDAGGACASVVEDSDADATTRAIGEVNVGIYCFAADWLRAHVGQVRAGSSGERYLTDLASTAAAEGRPALVVDASDPERARGINDRVQLARAERELRRIIGERHMLAGVTIVDPASTLIDVGVRIGADVRIEPWTILAGDTEIGEEAVIGPDSRISDSRIGARARVFGSWLEEAEVGEDARVGPMSHLRPGSVVGPGSEIGNYAEVKNSRLGRRVRQHHFGYLGDADVGDEVNVGAGTVTANFDGSQKHRTVIGEGAFLGVDTTLRAPVRIGKGARTGAGSVVTRDVPDGRTVVGMPARDIETRRTRPAAKGDA